MQNFTKHPVYGFHSSLVYAWHHETLYKRKVLRTSFVNSATRSLSKRTEQSCRVRVPHYIYESFRGFLVFINFIWNGFFFWRADSDGANFYQSSDSCVPKMRHLWAERICHLGGDLRETFTLETARWIDAEINRGCVESSVHFHFERSTHLATEMCEI